MFIVKLLHRNGTECSYHDYSVFESMVVMPFKTRKEVNAFIMKEANDWLLENEHAQDYLERYTGKREFPDIAYEDIEELEDCLIGLEENDIYSFIFEIEEFDDDTYKKLY